MFVDVPEPVWYTSIGNWSSSSPASARRASSTIGVGHVLLDHAQLGVDDRGVALDRRQRTGDAHVERATGDREVGDGEVGLTAPQMFGLVHSPSMPPVSYIRGRWPPACPWPDYRAVLFDLDGVLTPTADVHQRAWTVMFDEFLATQPGQAPFSEADYLAHVDGRPRFDGVRTFLASRGITLPEGDADEPPGQGSVSALGNRKNELFQRVLRDEGIAPYPGSLRLLDALGEDTKLAVVSSSRNAREVLDASGLAPRFDVVADGVTLGEEQLRGKPAPDLFLSAARHLGVAPADAVVVEDAVSGVAAGRAGDFALVIGVDRGAGPEALRAHGADIVVDDLGELVP